MDAVHLGRRLQFSLIFLLLKCIVDKKKGVVLREEKLRWMVFM